MAAGHPYPHSRVRNMAELYTRAYWRYYVVAVTWAGVSCACFQLLPAPFSPR